MHAIILIGGGEHACVIAEAIGASAHTLRGFVDPDPNARLGRFGVVHLGDDPALDAHRDATLVLGFGSLGPARWREAAIQRLEGAGFTFTTVIDPTAIVSRSASIGAGTVILAGAVVQTGAVIGQHCIINTGAVIEHDVQLGDHVQVGPRAAIGGGTIIGPRTFVGLGANVRDHLQIGSDATIAMGAVVVADVADATAVFGIPARPRAAAVTTWSGGHDG